MSKNFGALKVIDRLSLALHEGEALGVLGPNGAGKTTMFALIAGDLRPSGGSIHFRERDITGLPAHARCRLGIGRSTLYRKVREQGLDVGLTGLDEAV